MQLRHCDMYRIVIAVSETFRIVEKFFFNCSYPNMLPVTYSRWQKLPILFEENKQQPQKHRCWGR